MKIKKYNLNNKKVQFLINSDEKLGKLIKHIKSCQILIEDDGFKCIIEYIIGQQISDKTRKVIWDKMCEKYKDISPKTIMNISESELRDLGICKQKVTYIKNLASAVINKEIIFNDFKKSTNQEITNKLTKIKGIGNWTVEMYLIFSLGRENVFSKGDHTIKRVIKWMYNLENLPNNTELERYFSNWLQYATIVSAYFWEAISNDIMSKSIYELD